MHKVFRNAVLGSAMAMTAMGAWALDDTDKSFITDASQGDLTEIKLSQLALQKTSHAQVKMFAQKMVDDHTMLETKMKPFADKAGVAPATELNSEHQALYDKLNGLSGQDFDKAYVEAMDKDHHEDLTKFDSQLSSTKDAAFKKTVAQGRKVVAMHTKMIDGMSRKMGQTPATS